MDRPNIAQVPTFHVLYLSGVLVGSKGTDKRCEDGRLQSKTILDSGLNSRELVTSLRQESPLSPAHFPYIRKPMQTHPTQRVSYSRPAWGCKGNDTFFLPLSVLCSFTTTIRINFRCKCSSTFVYRVTTHRLETGTRSPPAWSVG